MSKPQIPSLTLKRRLNAALSGSGAAAAASAQSAPSAPVTAAPPPASAVGPKTK